MGRPLVQESDSPEEAAADVEQAALQTDVARFMATIAEAQNQPIAASAHQPSPSATGTVSASATTPTPSGNDSAGNSLHETLDCPAVEAVPKWAALTFPGFEDMFKAVEKALLVLKWLQSPVPEKRMLQSTQSLQQYQEVQKALLLLIAHLITGHIYDPDVKLQHILGKHLLRILRTWHELSEAAMTSPLLDALMLAVLQYMAEDELGCCCWLLVQTDEECFPFILQNLCKHLGVGQAVYAISCSSTPCSRISWAWLLCTFVSL